MRKWMIEVIAKMGNRTEMLPVLREKDLARSKVESTPCRRHTHEGVVQGVSAVIRRGDHRCT